MGTGRNDTNLMSLLVAIGPTDSRKVRHDYLKGNDEYVVQCLRSCDNTMAPFGWANTTNSTRALNMMANCRPCFDRCRAKLLVWMEVNKDWRSRCTKTNLQKYRRPSGALEANLVFNNPAVAIELGLHDAYSYLVRDMGVDVCDTSYRGFTSDVASKHQNMDKFVYSQLIVALYKGDVPILQTILSSPTFRLSSSPWTSMSLLSEWDILKFCLGHERVPLEAFETLLSNEQINANGTVDGCPYILKFIQMQNCARPYEDGLVLRVDRISSFLRAGANPLATNASGSSALSFLCGILRRLRAKRQLSHTKLSQHRLLTEVVQEMVNFVDE